MEQECIETDDQILEKIAYAANVEASRPKKSIGVYSAFVFDAKDISSVKTFGDIEQNYVRHPKLVTKRKVIFYSAAIAVCAVLGYVAANYSNFVSKPKENALTIDNNIIGNDSVRVENYFGSLSAERKKELIEQTKQYGINTREELIRFYSNLESNNKK